MLKRYSLPLVVAVAIVLFSVPAARAQETAGQEPKPIVTVAFSGYGQLVADLDFVGNLAGNPNLGQAIEAGLMLATGGQELKSLDKSKPWGLVVTADGPQFKVLGFVPLADQEELKAILEANTAEIEEADGKLTASLNDQKIYLKTKDGWTFLSHQPNGLDSLPDDPAAVLGGLEKSYNLAVRLNVQSVPQLTREMLLGFVQMGMQAGMSKKPGESDEQFALRAKLADQSIERLKRGAAEIETIQLGLNIDEKAPAIYLETEVIALSDTETARQLTSPKGLKTNFGGFVVSDAAISYNGVGRLEEDQVDQANAMIDGFRTNLHGELEGQELPEEVEKTAKRLVDDAFALVTSAVSEREMDLGVLFLADEKRATLLGGARVADGAKVEELLKAVVEEAAKEQPQLKEAVRFNAAEHAGVRMHTLTVPTNALGVPELSELFGEELMIVAGAADKAAYLSMGTDSLETLKKAIDAGKAPDRQLPPSQVTVSVGSLARLVAQYAPKPATQAAAKMIVDALAGGKDKDRLTITTTLLENGQKIRVEMEEDLLKVLGVLPAIAMGAMPM